MKTTKECYEALLAGEVLVSSAGLQVKMDERGTQVSLRQNGEWCRDHLAFTCPEKWYIYKEPPKPVSFRDAVVNSGCDGTTWANARCPDDPHYRFTNRKNEGLVNGLGEPYWVTGEEFNTEWFEVTE